MRLPLVGRIGGRSRLRRRAAACLLDEREGGVAIPPPHDDHRLARELEAMRAIVSTLENVPGDAWESELGPAPVLAPAAARRALAPAGARRGASRPRAVLRPAAALAAAACLAGAFVVGALTHPWTTSPPGGPVVARVILTPVSGTGAHGRAVAYMLGGSGRMRLHIDRLPRSRPGTYYELWLMTSTSDLVSVSSFRVVGHGSDQLDLILPADPTNYRYLDISVQHVGAGAAISSRSVLRGPIPT